VHLVGFIIKKNTLSGSRGIRSTYVCSFALIPSFKGQLIRQVLWKELENHSPTKSSICTFNNRPKYRKQRTPILLRNSVLFIPFTLRIGLSSIFITTRTHTTISILKEISTCPCGNTLFDFSPLLKEI